MTTLESSNCSGWLREKGIIEAPYRGHEDSPRCYDQLRLPSEPLRISAAVRNLIGTCRVFETALLQFTDWPLYQPDEMAIVTALRSAHGESRPLIETPGHLFPFSERDLLIGMFSLAICYQWTAYLYLEDATLLCWEGELLDIWSGDPQRIVEAREILSR